MEQLRQPLSCPVRHVPIDTLDQTPVSEPPNALQLTLFLPLFPPTVHSSEMPHSLSHSPDSVSTRGTMYMHITYTQTYCIYLRVSLNLKVTVTQVALHSELVDGRGVVVTHLRLLGIIAYPHTHVRATPITPDVVRKFKPR